MSTRLEKGRSARISIQVEYDQSQYTYTHWFRAVVVFSPYTAPCNRSVSDCIPSSPRRTSWTTSSVGSCVSSDPPTICSCAPPARCSALSLNARNKSSNVAVRNVHAFRQSRELNQFNCHLAVGTNPKIENLPFNLALTLLAVFLMSDIRSSSSSFTSEIRKLFVC